MDPGIALLILFVTVPLVAVSATKWRFFAQWLMSRRGRDWPTLTATIDLVDVIAQRGGRAGEVIYYLATLTYVYHNPELQTGEYSRDFDADDEDAARAWAASYKGSAVTVHVDPRDPTRSVLRKEDL